MARSVITPGDGDVIDVEPRTSRVARSRNIPPIASSVAGSLLGTRGRPSVTCARVLAQLARVHAQ